MRRWHGARCKEDGPLRADSGRILVGWALGPSVRGARAWSLGGGARLEQRNLISHSSQACQPVPAHPAVHIQAAFSCARRVTHAVRRHLHLSSIQGSRRAGTASCATGLKRAPRSHSHIGGERATDRGRSAHPSHPDLASVSAKKASKDPVCYPGPTGLSGKPCRHPASPPVGVGSHE